MTVPPRPLGLQFFDIVDLLEADLRPAFILDLEKNHNTSTDNLPIVYSNASLRDNAALVAEIVHRPTQSEQRRRFRTWATHTKVKSASPEDNSPTCAFMDIIWSKITLRDRWGIISANITTIQQSSDVFQHIPREPLTELLSEKKDASKQTQTTTKADSIATEKELADILRENLSLSSKLPTPLSEPSGRRGSSTLHEKSAYAHFIQNFDWSSTKLGPMDTWPRKLREVFNLVMVDSRPVALYWGDEFALVYNESFANTMGSQHPSFLGRRCKDIWPEAKDTLIGKFREVQTLGRASDDDEWQVFLDRLTGESEETYFTWSIVPVINEQGEPEGVLVPIFDTTKYRIWERRVTILNTLGEHMSRAVDIESFWESVHEGLEAASAEDVPFAILYRANDTLSPEAQTDGLTQSSRYLKLQSTLGGKLIFNIFIFLLLLQLSRFAKNLQCPMTTLLFPVCLILTKITRSLILISEQLCSLKLQLYFLQLTANFQ